MLLWRLNHLVAVALRYGSTKKKKKKKSPFFTSQMIYEKSHLIVLQVATAVLLPDLWKN